MIWLLRITVAGRTWYLASEPCEPVRAGVEIPHHGTLTVSGFGENIDIGGGVSGACTANVAFHLDTDWWAFFLDGGRLDGAPAEVSLWRPGSSYAERVVLLIGRVDTGGSIPIDGQDIEASVSAPLIDTAEGWPDAADVVNLTAWPNALADEDGTDLVGAPYPWPLGKLGAYTDQDGAAKRTSTTEVLIVDDTPAFEVGVIGGAQVAATTVRIWNNVHKDAHDFVVSTTLDGEGNPRATVSFATAPGPWVFDGSEKFYVNDWGAGGLSADFSTGTTQGLGDAILFLLLRRYGAEGPDRVDVGSWLAWRGVLNGWEVGFAPSPGNDPLTTITDQLLPMCPALWIVGGPLGYRPIFLAETSGALCRRLTVGRDIFVTDEQPGLAAIEPLNAITVSFAPSTARGDLRGVQTTSSSTLSEAAAGLTRHGIRAGAVELPATFDRGTAGLAGRESIRVRWTPPLYLVYDAPADVAMSLTLGERVRITDEGRGLVDRLAWIMARETDEPDTWTITVYGYW